MEGTRRAAGPTASHPSGPPQLSCHWRAASPHFPAAMCGQALPGSTRPGSHLTLAQAVSPTGAPGRIGVWGKCSPGDLRGPVGAPPAWPHHRGPKGEVAREGA